jgi:hypothetical protein
MSEQILSQIIYEDIIVTTEQVVAKCIFVITKLSSYYF